MQQWKIQYDRTIRSYEKLHKFYFGINAQPDEYVIDIINEYSDSLYSFFINCYHLKDYLKKDTNFTDKNNQEIEDLISQSRPLSLVADICNGVKHLELDKPRSSDDYSDIRQNIRWLSAYTANDVITKVNIAIDYKTELDGKIIEIESLARYAISEWNLFLGLKDTIVSETDEWLKKKLSLTIKDFYLFCQEHYPNPGILIE